MQRGFAQVDVFGEEPLSGNPVAVVLDADGLDDEAMQRLANWTNLSETVFLLEPIAAEADYRARIFTPTRELPFAGHPTLGACHAWLEATRDGARPERIVQECGVGLVEVRSTADGLAFASPPLIRSGPVAKQTVAEIVARRRPRRIPRPGCAGADRGARVLRTERRARRGPCDRQPQRLARRVARRRRPP